MSTIDKISVDGTVYDVAPGAGTVGTDALADGSVTAAKVGQDLGEAIESMCTAVYNEAMGTKATASSYGVVKIGDGITVSDGVISVSSSSSEVADGSITTAKLANNAVTGDKIASQTVTRANLKFYCIGKNQLDTLTVDSARLCSNAVTTEKIADGAVTGAKLGIASADTLGGVKVGDGLSIATDGTLSATGGGSGGSYTLPVATADTLGGVKVGTGLAVESDGTVYTTGEAVAVVAPATAETLGGIKVGDNLTITSDGTLSAPSSELADGSVTTAKLADKSVTSAKLANFCINRDELFNQGVVTYSSLHDTAWAAIYPVGSVYCTTNASFDPNSYSFSWSTGGTTLTLGRKQKTSGTWELLDNDGTVYRWKRVK